MESDDRSNDDGCLGVDDITSEGNSQEEGDTTPIADKSIPHLANSGVVYLSRIPTNMNVKKIREIFSAYGEIGRIFLQPNDKAPPHKKNKSFTEGWVEFMEKRKAKQVAYGLNNTQVGGKRKQPWYSDLWNIKYLPKFKWGHLNERLAYERAVHMQRMRTEISQAKKESNFFIQNVERNKVMKRVEKKKAKSKGDGEAALDTESQMVREWTFKQKSTDDEIESIRKRKSTNPSSGPSRKKSAPSVNDGSKSIARDKSFLKSIFSGGLVHEEGTND